MGSNHDESGTEFIRLTIVAEDGSQTVVEIPVGTGNFGQDPDTDWVVQMN